MKIRAGGGSFRAGGGIFRAAGCSPLLFLLMGNTNIVMPVRLRVKLATRQSQVKYPTTEPWRSHTF